MEQRLIDANALRAKAVYMHGFGENKYVPLKAIENAPAADVKVVKHGRWENLTHNEGWAYCSQCHCCWEWEIINNCNVRYCPNCGCKVDLEVTNGLDQH